MGPPSSESLLLGLHFALKNILEPSPGGGDMISLSRASSRLDRICAASRKRV